MKVRSAIYASIMSIVVLMMWLAMGIQNIEECTYGYYLDVRTNRYKVFAPLEKLTDNFIQVDSNE